MANGVNVTDKGMQFLVSVDGSEAMSQLRQLQTSMKGLATEIEKSVGLTQKTFNKTFDSLGQLVKQLDKNPGVGIPGAASKDANKFAQKLNQELEKQRKKMNEGFVEARQGISDLNKETNMFNTSVENLGDDIEDVNDKLSDMIGFGPKLKGLAAGLLAAFGIEALIEKTVELDEQLFQLGQRFNKTKDEIFDSSQKAAAGVNSTASAMNDLLAISADAGNNSLKLATSFGELSTKMGDVFGVDAEKAQSTLEALRQKGLVTTEESAKSLGDSFVVIRKQFGTSFDQMAESIGRNSEALSKMRENMIRLGKDPKVAEDAVRNLGNQLLVIESTFRKVGGVSNGVAQDLTNALAKISIEPLNVSFNRFKSVLGAVDGDARKLYDGLSKLAEGDATGMVKMLDQLDEKTQKRVLEMPAEHLQELFGGSVGEVKALIAAIQRVKEGGTSLTEEMEKYNKRMAEANEAGEILDRVWKEWGNTVGGAWKKIYTKVIRVFESIANIVREPLADFLNGIDTILQLFGLAVDKVDELSGSFKGLGTTIKGLGAAITAALSVGAISKFAGTLGKLPGGGALVKGLGMGSQTITERVASPLGRAVPGGAYVGLPEDATRTREATFREKSRMNLRRGAKLGGVAGLGMGVLQAAGSIRSTFEDPKATEEEKRGAIGGGIGMVVGGAAGGALGSAFGPIGTMVGAQIGATLGESLGEWAAGVDWEGMFKGALEWAASIGTSIAEWGGKITDTIADVWNDSTNWMKDKLIETFKSVVDWLVENIQKIPGFGTAMAVTEAAMGATGAVVDTAESVFSSVVGLFGSEEEEKEEETKPRTPPAIAVDSTTKERPLIDPDTDEILGYEDAEGNYRETTDTQFANNVRSSRDPDFFALGQTQDRPPEEMTEYAFAERDEETGAMRRVVKPIAKGTFRSQEEARALFADREKMIAEHRSQSGLKQIDGTSSDSELIEVMKGVQAAVENQTSTQVRIAESQNNATRVGGNPSATATQLKNMGNGAN